jgi:hypothetical protein
VKFNDYSAGSQIRKSERLFAPGEELLCYLGSGLPRKVIVATDRCNNAKHKSLAAAWVRRRALCCPVRQSIIPDAIELGRCTGGAIAIRVWTVTDPTLDFGGNFSHRCNNFHGYGLQCTNAISRGEDTRRSPNGMTSTMVES